MSTTHWSRKPRRGTRATDSDRNDACQVLDTALGEGQLSMEEHRQRVASAVNAATVGELHALVDDLQTSDAPALTARKPRATRRWGVWIAAAAVLVLVGVGVGWGISSNNSPRGPGPAAADTEASSMQLLSVYGLTTILDQVRKQWGDTMGFHFRVESERAYMNRPDAADQRRQLSCYYEGGWKCTSAGKSSGRLFDFAKFDVNAVIARVRGAPQILGIEQRDVDYTELTVQPSVDPTVPPDTMEITIQVKLTNGDYGAIKVDPQGGILKQDPPNP